MKHSFVRGTIIASAVGALLLSNCQAPEKKDGKEPNTGGDKEASGQERLEEKARVVEPSGADASGGQDASPPKKYQVKCHGLNDCKGKGACAGKDNTCAGYNECAGKGWNYVESDSMAAAQKLCESKGGYFEDKKVTVKCYGLNDCKGQGGCASKDHDCAGKNECKGKGWLQITAPTQVLAEKQCKEQGGSTTP